MTTIDNQGMAHVENGQYTEKTQSRPEVHLIPSNDGTFLFPPTHYGSDPEKSDLNAYIEFWSNAPISDGVLTNITGGYADLVRRQKIVESSAWGGHYDAQNKKALTTGSETSKAAALVARQAAYDAFFEKWHETNPAKIKATSARTIARAGQLSYFSRSLAAEDEAKIDESTMSVNEVDMTISEIVIRYRLGELRDFFQDPDATAAERLEDLRQELRMMRRGD